MITFASLCMMLWGFALALVLLGTYLALRHFRQTPTQFGNLWRMQPISILKPLKGLDPGLEENLLSFFNLEYPSYELLFCVADERDPALHLVRRLCLRFPQRPTRILTSAEAIGPNPKVNNLVQAYEQAQFDWILISDSNVRVRSDYLQKLASVFEQDVGVVTAVVAGQGPQHLGGYLEATYLNTFYNRWMFVAAFFGHPCVIGKSMLFRKSTAKRFGGIRNLARYLAEDYMAGIAVQYLGLRVTMMTEPVAQQIGAYRVRDFWSRHIRWGRIRKSQAPAAFFSEPWFGSFISGGVGALGLAYLWPGHVGWFLMLHFLIWFFCDALLMKAMSQPLNWMSILSWCLRECSALPLWLHIACGNTVNWRGRHLRVERGGILAS